MPNDAMTPKKQARKLLILLDSYHQYDGPTRLKKSERAIAAALSQVDAQWKNTLAEMEACYLKREGDIHARIAQAGQEEREACAMVAEKWYELPDEVTDMSGNPTIEKIIGNAIRRARAQESRS